MENCLVTKLKGTVNNDALPKLGVIKLKFKAVQSPTINTNQFYVYNDPEADGDVVITVTSPTGGLINQLTTPADWTAVQYTSYTLHPGGVYNGLIANVDATIEISGKYNIKGLKFQSMCNELKFDDLFCPKMTTLELNTVNFSGDITVLNSLPASIDSISLRPATSYTEGSICAFIGSKNIRDVNINNLPEQYALSSLFANSTALRNVYIADTPLIGDIAYFLNDEKTAKRFANLNILSIGNTPNITKEAEDVATLRQLGVTIYGVE